MNVLGLFSRLPQPGRTKTRLAATIGPELAARLADAFIDDLIMRFRDGEAQLIAVTTPAGEATREYFSQRLGTAGAVEFQAEGNLGDRIATFCRTQFRRGVERVVVIGSDSPDLPASLVTDAFASLNEHGGTVIAPADDGGFVLLGLCSGPRTEAALSQLAAVSWGNETTCEQTVAALRAAELTPSELRQWYDVDTEADLRVLASRLSRDTTAAASTFDCPATRQVLRVMGFLTTSPDPSR